MVGLRSTIERRIHAALGAAPPTIRLRIQIPELLRRIAEKRRSRARELQCRGLADDAMPHIAPREHERRKEKDSRDRGRERDDLSEVSAHAGNYDARDESSNQILAAENRSCNAAASFRASARRNAAIPTSAAANAPSIAAELS